MGVSGRNSSLALATQLVRDRALDGAPDQPPSDEWRTVMHGNGLEKVHPRSLIPHRCDGGCGCDGGQPLTCPLIPLLTHQCTRQFPPLRRQQWMKLIHSLKCFLLEKKAIR